jgi:hypothetical protein
MKFAGISILLFLFCICGETADVTSSSLDQEFRLKLGSSDEIRKEELQSKFSSVLEDSRCPKGEQCITQGKGVIELELTKGKNKPESVQLNTTSDSQGANDQGYTIRLIDLAPYPKANQLIHQEDYEATLVVSIGNGNK